VEVQMGMFDTIRCSFDLGPGFWNRELQTKSLENFMTEYWLDPKGRLFEIDYSGTTDYIMDDNELFGYRLTPNGNHGKIKPTAITKYIEVYPATWDCKYSPFPRQIIHLINGQLISYEASIRN